jgi:hypothetical protein
MSNRLPSAALHNARSQEFWGGWRKQGSLGILADGELVLGIRRRWSEGYITPRVPLKVDKSSQVSLRFSVIIY